MNVRQRLQKRRLFISGIVYKNRNHQYTIGELTQQLRGLARRGMACKSPNCRNRSVAWKKWIYCGQKGIP